MRIILEGLGFRHVAERLLDHGIPVGDDAQAGELAELDGDDVLLDVRLQPVHATVQVGVGPVNVLCGEELLEVGQDGGVDLEVLVDGVRGHENRREAEEDVLIVELVLEASGLGRLDLLVRGDAAAAVNGAARVSELNLAVAGVGRGPAAGVIVVVVERNPLVLR